MGTCSSYLGAELRINWHATGRNLLVAFIWSYSPYRRKSRKKKMGEKEKAVKPSVTSGRKLMRPMRTNYLALGIHVLCRNSESFLNFAPCVMQLASIGPLSVPVYLSRLQLTWIRFEFLENILYPWSIYSLYMVSYIRFQWFSTEYVAISSLRRPILIVCCALYTLENIRS